MGRHGAGPGAQAHWCREGRGQWPDPYTHFPCPVNGLQGVHASADPDMSFPRQRHYPGACLSWPSPPPPGRAPSCPPASGHSLSAAPSQRPRGHCLGPSAPAGPLWSSRLGRGTMGSEGTRAGTGTLPAPMALSGTPPETHTGHQAWRPPLVLSKPGTKVSLQPCQHLSADTTDRPVGGTPSPCGNAAAPHPPQLTRTKSLHGDGVPAARLLTVCQAQGTKKAGVRWAQAGWVPGEIRGAADMTTAGAAGPATPGFSSTFARSDLLF